MSKRIACSILLLALSMSCAKKKSKEKNMSGEELIAKAFSEREAGREEAALKIFEKVLKVQPKNSNALVQLGMSQMSKAGKEDISFERIERAFDDDAIPMPVPIHSKQGQWLATIAARRRFERQEFITAHRFFEKAAQSQAEVAACQHIQRATSLLSSFPASLAEAKARAKRYTQEMREILEMLEDEDSSLKLGPHDGDPLTFCVLTAFYQTAYYVAEHRISMGLYAQVMMKTFPFLQYTAPHLSTASPVKTCRRRLRIGIASGMMYPGTPPLADFGQVLGRLSREDFNMTFIYLKDPKSPPSVGVLEERGYNATPPYGYNEIVKPEDGGITIEKGKAHEWIEGARAQVAALDLDLLLYLDCTMYAEAVGSAMTTQLAMSRLARVQAVSHGHPTTSGVARSSMDYYISWAAAELGSAQDHYTEELALLPAETMHQWYESRVTANGASTENGQEFLHLTREDFARNEGVPADGRWYLCMQKPFKRMPEYDKMLGGIHQADPSARLVLHDAESDEMRDVIRWRFKKAGVDLTRVHFLGAVPHHRLLALYRLADVTLDSYPMGGCTTTREALEVGGLVVTLPAKYLGSRWSLAYYTILGVTDLVATDPEHYVALAVRVASDLAWRAEVQEKVKGSLHKLFRRPEAVQEWRAMLMRLARGPGLDEACQSSE